VVVPVSAVQNVTGTPIVFVRTSIDLFEARPVTLGAKQNGQIEIAGGLRPDEPVVVAGGFALKSQFLASRLGAGCVDD
jgi:cobalt-zinc-cadmium efflux system membrane fusion protein